VGSQWLAGVVFHTGQNSSHLDRERNIVTLPVDTLWRP
jgi:hypothetical protein